MTRRLAKLGQIFDSPLDRLDAQVTSIVDPWTFAPDPTDPGPSPVPVGRVKVWNGTSWVARNLKHFDGAAFQPSIPKFWNGTIWVPYTPPAVDEKIFSLSAPSPESGDNLAVVLGCIVRCDGNGTLKGVKVYRGAANTQANIEIFVYELNPSGYNNNTLLANRTGMTIGAGPGWTDLLFTTPVSLTSGKYYLFGYRKPVNGNTPYYYGTGGVFAGSSSYTSPSGKLTAIDGSDSGPWGSTANNGRYIYSASLAFPTANFGNTWYGIDVIFTP